MEWLLASHASQLMSSWRLLAEGAAAKVAAAEKEARRALCWIRSSSGHAVVTASIAMPSFVHVLAASFVHLSAQLLWMVVFCMAFESLCLKGAGPRRCKRTVWELVPFGVLDLLRRRGFSRRSCVARQREPNKDRAGNDAQAVKTSI